MATSTGEGNWPNPSQLGGLWPVALWKRAEYSSDDTALKDVAGDWFLEAPAGGGNVDFAGATSWAWTAANAPLVVESRYGGSGTATWSTGAVSMVVESRFAGVASSAWETGANVTVESRYAGAAALAMTALAGHVVESRFAALGTLEFSGTAAMALPDALFSGAASIEWSTGGGFRWRCSRLDHGAPLGQDVCWRCEQRRSVE